MATEKQIDTIMEFWAQQQTARIEAEKVVDKLLMQSSKDDIKQEYKLRFG